MATRAQRLAEFGEQGTPPAGAPVANSQLSPLGRLLLTRIGLAAENDR